MRGYFAIGVEGLSKPVNFGNLMRSAHAFGAAFFFTVDADAAISRSPPSDTSRTVDHLPYYAWSGVAAMALPAGCQLVGVELADDSIDLPSFRHPRQAAYVLGPERGRLSEAMLARADHLVRIPTAFCINVATAGAIVMYDRLRLSSRFGRRAAAAEASGQSDDAGKAGHGGPFYHGGERVRHRKGRGGRPAQ